MLPAVRAMWRSDYATVCTTLPWFKSRRGLQLLFRLSVPRSLSGMLMIKSINGWVEDNSNPGMFSKVINGEHVQTYVSPDDNAHRKLTLVEAQLTNPVLLRVIPLIFSLMARWRRCALGNAVRAVGRHLRGP